VRSRDAGARQIPAARRHVAPNDERSADGARAVLVHDRVTDGSTGSRGSTFRSIRPAAAGWRADRITGPFAVGIVMIQPPHPVEPRRIYSLVGAPMRGCAFSRFRQTSGCVTGGYIGVMPPQGRTTPRSASRCCRSTVDMVITITIQDHPSQINLPKATSACPTRSLFGIGTYSAMRTSGGIPAWSTPGPRQTSPGLQIDALETFLERRRQPGPSSVSVPRMD
jgi:hypothetical protein